MKRSCSVSMLWCNGCVQVQGGIGTAAVGLWPHRSILRCRVQGWQGRWTARFAGRQILATPAGSRVDIKNRSLNTKPSFTPQHLTRTTTVIIGPLRITISVIIGSLRRFIGNFGLKIDSNLCQIRICLLLSNKYIYLYCNQKIFLKSRSLPMSGQGRVSLVRHFTNVMARQFDPGRLGSRVAGR